MDLVIPLALILLGLGSWLLARQRLHIGGARPVPRLLSGFIALFGVVCALYASAELVFAVADAGIAVLLDPPLMFFAFAFVILGGWCAIAGVMNLTRSGRQNVP